MFIRPTEDPYRHVKLRIQREDDQPLPTRHGLNQYHHHQIFSTPNLCYQLHSHCPCPLATSIPCTEAQATARIMARRTRHTGAHRHTIAVRRICRCKPSCHQPFTAATRKKHYAELVTKAQRAAKEDSLTYSSEDRSEKALELEDAAASEPPEYDHQPEDYGGGGVYDDNDDASSPFDILTAALSGRDSPRHAPSDADPEDGEDDEQPEDADYEIFDETVDTDEPVSREDIVKLLEEMFGPAEDGTTFDFRNDILTEKDRDNIRLFYCKLRGCIPRDTFQMIRRQLPVQQNHGVLGPAWDPLELPLRTEQSFVDALAKINAARTAEGPDD
ncbi:hypothetical protein MKEN_01168900 [Mycena kentingensis (nom. inval.)]|nr:hypothetical protein MKEN_01168900 [Mycena kentingensis (nom. inval.)]